MYLHNSNSEPKDHLDIDPAAHQYHQKPHQRPSLLPPIDSMTLPGFSYSRNQQFPNYRQPHLESEFTPTAASPAHPYPDNTIYSSGMPYHPSQSFPRSYYRTETDLSDREMRYRTETDISDRDIRYEHDQRQMSYSLTQAPPLTNLITHETPLPLEPPMLLPPNQTFYAEPPSASQSPPDDDATTSTAKPRKARREKPRIELAPDQPLTTQGRLRSRVYVACMQCRTRKIRCDGAKPACHNCSRRPTANGTECSYDSAPKRRGPDKTPGARQRTVRGTIVDTSGSASRRRRKQKSDDDDTANQSRASSSHEDGGHHQLAGLPVSPVFLVPPPSEEVPSRDIPKFADVAQNVPLNTIDDSFATPIQGFGGGDRYNISPQPRSGRSYINEYEYQRFLPPNGVPSQSYKHVDDDYDKDSEDVANIVSQPSLDFIRKTWWDSLLAIYAPSSTNHNSQTLTLSERTQAANVIANDLRFLFRSSNYWFSFFNIPRFFSTYFEPEKRERMQPSLVIAALALATFFQSSEVGLGKEGRRKALRLRDIAQGALEASVNANWIDDTLAQAAWLLAMFEVCAHPLHSSERSASSMVMLDTIIHTLSLTFLDANDPQASRFTPRAVPTVLVDPPQSHDSWSPTETIPSYTIPRVYHPSNGRIHNYTTTSAPQSSTMEKGCSCASLVLGQRWSGAGEHAPLWLSTPAWDENWTDSEVTKESCRRLCWSALMLTAAHSSYANAYNRVGPELFLVEPSNYALLLPGESLFRSQVMPVNHSPKNTVWALYYRTMMLWHSCLRVRQDPNTTEDEKARFGVHAWLEADTIEKALENHTCGIERAFLFQGREYLFNVRMCISHEFRRYIPLATAANGLFHRTKAEEWLSHQANVAQRVVHAMHTLTGQASNTLLHRPFFIFWFMSQMSRALALWECDNTLGIALDVCIAFFKPIDYLSTLWPCEEQRSRCQKLREQLSRACSIAGRPLPPPSPSFEDTASSGTSTT